MTASPPFGEADLTNCERELIHLAASIQPQGVLLTLQGPTLQIVQVSANCAALLGRAPDALLGRPLREISSDVAARVGGLVDRGIGDEPVFVQGLLPVRDRARRFEGLIHCVEGRWWVLELEPLDDDLSSVPPVDLDRGVLRETLERGIKEISAASTVSSLADATVHAFRRLTGYDRVMVYRFDRDGHGQVVAEDRDVRLESLLDHRYPASDIPQRARHLYLRNRLRVLADVHYEPAPLVPRALPDAEHGELDMSLCYLRSMSPLHLQYLENMGVTATLVVSLVRNGKLWGLVAAHHYTPRNLGFAIRTGCDLLGEVVSTRLAAIENYAYAHVALQVHRLERRLVEATSTDGDWRVALFRNPWGLLRPVEATGAVLSHQGELLTAGEVPSTPQLHALFEWLGQVTPADDVFECSSVAHANPELEDLTPTASGVLAVRLSASSPDFLVWLRKEQLRNETWAGDPNKPVLGDDPSTLSPRRSFAAWTELVRETALPWSSAELVLARAFGASLVDIIGRVDAVRFLIAEHQLSKIRESVVAAKCPMLLVAESGRPLVASGAYRQLFGAGLEIPAVLQEELREMRRMRRTWRRRTELLCADGRAAPFEVRAELVPGSDGRPLGFYLLFEDLSAHEATDHARRHLEESFDVGRSLLHEDPVVSAVQANASLAAMDIADGHPSLAGAGALHEVEQSTKRATELYRRVLDLASDDPEHG